MLQAMRDGSKGIVAKIIVGLIILTFALFGIDSIVALGGGQDAPAEVNGVEISELQVNQMAQMQKRRMQAQFGDNFGLDDERLKSIALEGLINEAVLKQASQKSGGHFSIEEIDKIILQSPEFQVGGVFDKNQFDLALRSAGFTRSSYRDLLKTNLLIQQSQNAWQATAFSTESEQKAVAALDSQSRDFSTVSYSFEDVKQTVTVSDSEAETYYAENSANYMTQETVVVDYIELKESELVDSIFVDEDQIANRYEEMKAEAAAKKEYRAAHILLLSSDESAKKKINDVLAKLNSGESFSDLAKEFSEDDSSKFSGGDLGFSSLEVFEPEFSAALMELEVGAISGVVETRDGLHIVKLLEERQPSVGELSSVKSSIEAALKKELAQTAFVEGLEVLKDEAFATSTIADAAKAQGLKVMTSLAFSNQGGSGIASHRSVVEAAFSDMVLNEGANSEVIEIGEGYAVVIHLNKFNESVVKPFSDVKSQIVSLLENKAARDKLENLSQEALENARDGELSANWVSVSDKRRTSEGVDAVVLKAVFALPEAEEKTYTLVDGANGDKVLVRLDRVVRSDAVAGNADAGQKVARSKAYNEYRAYQKFVTELSDIERN